jgi:hypothetical protein
LDTELNKKREMKQMERGYRGKMNSEYKPCSLKKLIHKDNDDDDNHSNCHCPNHESDDNYQT